LKYVTVSTSDSVSRFNDSTWLESPFLWFRFNSSHVHHFWWCRFDSSHVENDVNSTRITFFTKWLDSNHNQWIKTPVRIIFTKSLSFWWTNLVCLHTQKKKSIFSSAMIKVGAHFCFSLSVMLCYIWG